MAYSEAFPHDDGTFGWRLIAPRPGIDLRAVARTSDTHILVREEVVDGAVVRRLRTSYATRHDLPEPQGRVQHVFGWRFDTAEEAAADAAEMNATPDVRILDDDGGLPHGFF